MMRHNQKVKVRCKHDKRDMWASDGNGHIPDDETWYEAHIKQGEILDCTVYHTGYIVFDFEHIGTATTGKTAMLEYTLDPQDDDFSFYFEIIEE